MEIVHTPQESAPEDNGDPPPRLTAAFALAVLVLFIIATAIVGPTREVVGGFLGALALSLMLGNVEAVREWFRRGK